MFPGNHFDVIDFNVQKINNKFFSNTIKFCWL